MLMNYDNTIMEILQKTTISAVVVLMNCDKLTIKGKITGKNNLIGIKRLANRRNVTESPIDGL